MHFRACFVSLCVVPPPAIVRAGCSNGQIDGNGVHSVANAWAAGIQHVDIYMLVFKLLLAVRNMRASYLSIPRLIL